MEGADTHAEGHPADELLDAAHHLAGGFIGERHRQDVVRGHAMVQHQVGDTVGKDPGLAGTGTGEDQNRPVDRFGRFALLRI